MTTAKIDLDVIKLTQKMVQTPSFSGEEGNMADLVQATMLQFGFTDVRRDAYGSVLGFVGPENADTALLFDGHMDVVPVVGQWSVDPFGGEIKHGRLYGRGTTDMKGGIAAALCAAAEAAATGKLKYRIGVSASVLEEVIEGFALSSVLDFCTPRAVVICEPSKLLIKAGQKGRMELVLTLHGKTAHAASPEYGVNPLYAAAQALQALSLMPLPSHPVLGQALLVPTDIISTPFPSVSMIPLATTIRFDRRTLPGENKEDILADIRACLEAAGIQDFSLEVTVAEVKTFTGEKSTPSRWLPAWQLDKKHAFLSTTQSCLAQHGRDSRAGCWHFCTNGSESAGRRNIPTIGLGPGNEEDAHTVDESIALDQLTEAVKIYRAMCLSFGS